MSNFDPAIAQRVRDEIARAKLENDAVCEDGGDEDAIEDGVLKDGYSLIVPLFMADGSINPKLTFAQRLMAEKAQKAQRAATDAAASTSTTGGPTMTTRNYTMADAQRFGLQDASALSRPGFRYNGADPYARDEAIIAYHDRDLEDAEAWKTKPPLPYSTELTGEGGRGPYDKTGMGREFDSCMTNTGERGRKIDIGGKLVCVPLETAEEYMREAAETDTTSAQDRLSARDALHRPGYRHNVNDAKTRDALKQSYADYETELTNAYMNPHNNEKTGFGSRGPVDRTGQGTVGQSCTVNGKSGTLQYVAGSNGLTCIPDDEADDWADGLSDKQIAHEEYRRDLETAWRNPTADVLDSDHLPVRRTGVDTRDASTVARDHQETMNQLYAQLDRELSEKWRNP